MSEDEINKMKSEWNENLDPNRDPIEEAKDKLKELEDQMGETERKLDLLNPGPNGVITANRNPAESEEFLNERKKELLSEIENQKKKIKEMIAEKEKRARELMQGISFN